MPQWGVHVSRIGFTSLKGARHLGRPFVDLTRDGPVGDRVFCLVDLARGRVLRTVENPTLVQTRATWDYRRDQLCVTAAALLPGTRVPTRRESSSSEPVVTRLTLAP